MFGWLFGDSNKADKVLDAVISTGDKLVTTEEEKAEFNRDYRNWYIRYLDATAPQALTRRLIACAVFGLWFVLVLSLSMCRLAEIYFTDHKGWNLAGDEIGIILIEHVNTPASIIMGFYFLAHNIRAFKQ